MRSASGVVSWSRARERFPRVEIGDLVVDLEVRRVTLLLRVLAEHRAKIEPDPSRPRYVITEPGVGYRLQDEAL